MKKRIYLPLTLLMAVSAQAADLAPDTPEVVVAPEAPAVVEAPVVAEAAAPVVEAPTTEVAAPVVEIPAAPVAQPATALPTEDDINKLLALLEAYDKQSSVIRNLHDLAATDTQTVMVDKTAVRSLLTLLELHKKEADLIVSLRASLAAIQSLLGSWDGDVAHLVAKGPKPTVIRQKQNSKKDQKPASRDVDYEKVKNLSTKK